MSQFFPSGGQRIGVSASSEYSGLISFRIDWLDLLAVQGTLKSLLHHHNSKASIFHFLYIQLSHWYLAIGKNMAFTIQTLLTRYCLCFFNMLSRFVIAFLSRTKHLFDFVAAVTVRSDFRAQENKICHSFHCLPIYLP